MLSKLISLIMLISIVNISLAECIKDVTFLNKGEAAPCSGFLFSPEKELKVRIMNEENKFFTQQLELLNKQVNLLNESIRLQESITNKERDKAELWRIRAEDSTRKLIESEDGRGKRDLIFVIGGVILTIGAGYVASKFWSR